VIIISTVRSSREFVSYDLKHTLGFVANPRRFNGMYIFNYSSRNIPIVIPVSVTRAKALLIVIGDPVILSLDPLWRAFLNYIYNNGGWKGPPITWDPNAPINEKGGYDESLRKLGLDNMNEFTRRMESLTIAGAAGEADESDDDWNVDQPWREVE